MKKRIMLSATALAAVAVVAVSGTALAGNGGKADKGTPLRDEIAAKLGITPAQFQAAFAAVMVERIDAAVASGKLSAERAAKLKQAIAEGKLAKLRLGFHKQARVFATKRGASLKAFTQYLDVTNAELRAELKSGKSLADIAKAHGKTADGLVKLALERLSDRLDKAVERGRLTETRKQELLAKAKQRLDKLVTTKFVKQSG
jgi:hypothetical protein